MPRIKAALALLATAVFCIGFNVVRYPVVWQMVAASAPPAESAKFGQGAAAPGASKSGAARAAPPSAAIRGEDSSTAATDPTADSWSSKPTKEAATTRYGLKPYSATEGDAARPRDSDEESPTWSDGSTDSYSYSGRSTAAADESPTASRSEWGTSFGSETLSPRDSADAAPKRPQPAGAKSAARSGGKKSEVRPSSSGIVAKKSAGGGKTADRSHAKRNTEPSDDKKPWENGYEASKPECSGDVCAMPGSANLLDKSSTSADSENPWGRASRDAEEATPNPPYGTAAESVNAHSWPGSGSSILSTRPDKQPPMVPVVNSASPSDTASNGFAENPGWGDRDPWGDTSATGSSRGTPPSSYSTSVPRVRRLPPVAQTASIEPEPAALFDGSVPVYPMTKSK